MNDRVFLDTNFLGYTADENSPEKKKIAKRMLCELTMNDQPVISTQVLQEFYNVATKKMNIDELTAKTLVHNFSKIETIVINTNIIEQAIDISVHNKISFWDGLIVSAAEFANCSMIITEDLNNGQIIRGIKIIDPFKR
jgi:predicted nucleic acid-binding protein